MCKTVLKMLIYIILISITSSCVNESDKMIRDAGQTINASQTIDASQTSLDNTGIEGSMLTVGKRVFLELEYLCSVPYNKLAFLEYYTYEKDEFTYWIHYNNMISVISAFEAFEADMPTELLHINYDDKTVIISFNRKLQYLFHDNKLHGWAQGNLYYHGRPVFEKDYECYMLHIYLTDKIDLIENEWYGTDLADYNILEKIPFDLEYYKNYK